METQTIEIFPPKAAQELRQLLMTRTQAARHIGVSVATVRRMEGGELHPVIVDGIHYFSVDELEPHRKVTPGEIAARAFEMFNSDKTQVDVVIALKESPDRIRELFRHWHEMSDCIVAGAPGLGGRRMHQLLKLRLTRRLVWLCLNIVLGDPQLRTKVERALGYELS